MSGLTQPDLTLQQRCDWLSVGTPESENKICKDHRGHIWYFTHQEVILKRHSLLRIFHTVRVGLNTAFNNRGSLATGTEVVVLHPIAQLVNGIGIVSCMVPSPYWILCSNWPQCSISRQPYSPSSVGQIWWNMFQFQNKRSSDFYLYNLMTVNNHTSNPPPQNDIIALLLPVLLHVRWLKLPSPSLPEAPSAPSAFVHMALLLFVWSAGRHLSVVRPAGGAGTVVGKW